MHDTRKYQVEFADGVQAEYQANLIAENLYSQIDDEGRQYSQIEGIADHKCDEDAIPKEAGWTILNSGAKKRKITTKGWWLLIKWKDGTSSWASLREAKESNPIEVAEYSVSAGINDEPAFAWWVGYTLNKRNKYIKKINHRMVKKKLKFGVTVPESIEEAYALDKENGNNLWANSIEKERKNVIIAFELLEEGEHLPVGSKLIPTHWIFDVRFCLTRKARLVAGGHRNKDVPKHMTYSSVVSRESVRLCFLIASLNDLDILAADIGNAYLNAPCKEKVHTKIDKVLFGPESEGKTAVIVRALYGLKTSGNSWRLTLSLAITEELGFTQCKADPDVYLKLKVDDKGNKYYAYLVTYVDDILVLDINPNITMNAISNLYRLKDGIAFPNMYLGTDVRKWEFEDQGTGYALGANSYLKEAIRVANKQKEKLKITFPTSRQNGKDTPFSTTSYRPEMEVTPLCDPEQANVYQNLIGVLRWLIELGRIDILLEVSLLSQYLAAPRIGHLQQLFNIFRYLKHHMSSWMVTDAMDYEVEWVPKNGETSSPWDRAIAMKELYSDAIDEIPPDMPEPLGKTINLNVFVDADHAGNKVTRRSHTGIIIFGNMTPINWFSKRQNTVETSTYSSEMIALRIAIEITEGIRYKLRMMGVPVEEPARIYCDNESVVKNTTYPESALKKKHCSIAYHKIRESVASNKVIIFHESTNSNLADLFTKVLPFDKRSKLIRCILHR
jgi:hypothetical protein